MSFIYSFCTLTSFFLQGAVRSKLILYILQFVMQEHLDKAVAFIVTVMLVRHVIISTEVVLLGISVLWGGQETTVAKVCIEL